MELSLYKSHYIFYYFNDIITNNSLEGADLSEKYSHNYNNDRNSYK